MTGARVFACLRRRAGEVFGIQHVAYANYFLTKNQNPADRPSQRITLNSKKRDRERKERGREGVSRMQVCRARHNKKRYKKKSETCQRVSTGVQYACHSARFQSHHNEREKTPTSGPLLHYPPPPSHPLVWGRPGALWTRLHTGKDTRAKTLSSEHAFVCL